MSDEACYPARLKPVIDELLTIVYGPIEGPHHAMVQALLKDALSEVPDYDSWQVTEHGSGKLIVTYTGDGA